MIYTVTFNPALDYVIQVPELKMGETNRTKGEQLFYGGKGINVSCILKNLEIENTALGFTAGYIGQALEKGLDDLGIITDFIRLSQGETRINVKIKGDEETEINAVGPTIEEKNIKQLFDKIDTLKKGDVLVLAGSIPKSVGDDIYEKIMERLHNKEIKIIVDATKDLLLNVLKYKPFLVKPNKQELADMMGVTINSIEDVKENAIKLQKLGAQNVIVSMAAEGAFLADSEGGFHKIGIFKGKTVNSVGAGDSMVAGFLAGLMLFEDYKKALLLATAAGGATAHSMGLGTRQEIMKLYNEGGVLYENY